MRRPTMVASVLSLSLLLAACGGAAPSGTTPDDGVLVFGTQLTSAVSGRLDPASSTSVCDAGVMAAIYGTLTERDPITNDALPGLAESWRVLSPTALELTLRPGVTFHDGTAFDAAAVKAGLEHNAAGEGQVAGTLSRLVAGIEVVDARTLVISLARPAAGSLPVILSGREGMIIAPGTGATADTAPVGAGAFAFASQVRGQRIDLVASPQYWNADEVDLAGVRLVDSDVGPPTINALITGEVDMAEVTPAEIAAIDTEPALSVATQPSFAYYKMSFNVAVEPFDDPRFRQALNLAVNREQLRDAVFAGEGDGAWGSYPPTFAGHDPGARDVHPHDPARARELLAGAGLLDRQITAFLPPSPLFRRLGEVLQAQLAEGGIRLNFRQSTDITQDYFQEGAESAAVLIWPTRPDPVDTLLIQFTPGAFTNTGEYDDPELNELVGRARATADGDERGALLRTASRLVVDEALELPLVFVPQIKAYGERIEGGFRQFDQCQMIDFATATVRS